MADAKKCDRCGKFYEKERCDDIKQCILERYGVVERIYTQIDHHPISCDIIERDMCQECRKELSTWFNSLRTENKGEN